jgi:hypothetical protein
MKDMTIQTLKSKLKTVKKLKFVPTHRIGDTGIGKTLEDLLEIKENNIPLCDIGKIAELKAYRKDATSMLTLFTLEPKPKGGDRDRFLLDNFGYSKRDNKRLKELHSTVICKRYNNQGLKLAVRKDRVSVLGKNRRLNIFWDMEILRQKFNEKLPALIYVLADRKIINGRENFYFNEAYFLSGFNFDLFKKMVRKDFIVVDFRMYYRPNGSVRNHGTGFRVKINKLYNCFKKKVRLV